VNKARLRSRFCHFSSGLRLSFLAHPHASPVSTRKPQKNLQLFPTEIIEAL
jgi:hypothetical protein